MQDIDNLEWGLKDSRISARCLSDKGWDVRYFDKLVKDLRSGRCEQIREKIKDATTLKKLEAIMSELEFARDFSTKYRVRLITDDETGYGASPPDMILFADGVDGILVEVTMLGDGYFGTRIRDKLREFSKKTGFSVSYSITGDSAHSALGKDDHEVQDKLIDRCINELNEEISRQSSSSASETKIPVDDITFTLIPSDRGMYTPQSISKSDVIKVDTPGFKRYIKGRLEHKAKQQSKLIGLWKDKPYVIALHNKDLYFDKIDLSDLLYGESIDVKEKIACAVQNGWNSFPDEKYSGMKSTKAATLPGLYSTEDWTQNLSGILFKDGSSCPQFFPNPFCQKEQSLDGI